MSKAPKIIKLQVDETKLKPKDRKQAGMRKKKAAAYLDTKEKLRKESQPSAEIMKVAGGHGKDSRDPRNVVIKNGVNSQLLKSVNTSVQIKAQCSGDAVVWFALAPISVAIERGWLAVPNDNQSAGGSETAYYAFRFLLQTYYNVMEGSYPTIQSAPLWFWETAAALMPASSRFKTGSVQYKWAFTPQNPQFKLQYAGGGIYYFGVPGGGTANGFPVLVDPANPYTDEAGSRAIADLFAFMNSQGMAKVVEKPDTRKMDQDVSAFASSYPEWGLTTAETGGLATSLYSEVKILCPIMAKFAQYQQNNDQWRGFQDSRKGSGTSSYIIPRVLEFKDAREFRNKAAPVFKFYNFDEYFLTISYILGLASEGIANDQSQASIPECPLTSQQVQLILRQSILKRFSNSYAQDLIYTNNLAMSMTPFCVGPNGSSTSLGQGMKLPFVFLENLRSATRRTIRVGKGQDYVVDTLPILARIDSVPQLGNFQYKDRMGNMVPLYKTDPSEVAIRLTDLSFNNATQFVTVTGEPLNTLIGHWNDYITKLSNSLSTLGTIGEEAGISALLTTFNSRHINETPVIAAALPPQPGVPTMVPLTKGMIRGVSSKNIGSQIPKRGKVGGPIPEPGQSDQYVNWSASFITSTDPFYSSLWRYTSAFVQPVVLGGYKNVYDSSMSFTQVFQIEPFRMAYSDIPSIISTNADQLTSVNTLCYNAATLDIKTNLASPPEAEIELPALAQTGRGGFFTSLAGAIGEGFGIPGAREVANTIGAITGL